MAISLAPSSSETSAGTDSSSSPLRESHRNHDKDHDIDAFSWQPSQSRDSTHPDTILSPLLPLLAATFYTSISGLLFGYQLGIASGSLHSLQSSLSLSNSQVESITSTFFLGLMIASPFGGSACDRFGRKTCILYTDGAFWLASMVLFFAPNYPTVLAGRFLSGSASGISLVSAVSYLTELSSDDHSHRGALVSAIEASISLGFLVSYVASYLLTRAIDMKEGWRILFGLVTCALAFLQWLGMRRMPESPVWLEQMRFHDRESKLFCCRTDLINSDNYDDTSSSMDRVDAHGVQQEAPKASHLGCGSARILLLEMCPPLMHYWKQSIIIAFLAIAEQFSGHINIINYSPLILAEVFFDHDEAQAEESSELLITTIILAVVKLLVTIFVLLEVDALGRLFLMKAGVSLITLSLLLLALGLSVTLEASYDTASGVGYMHRSFQDAMVLIGCAGCIAGFALSYGPITWLLVSELSHSSIRGRMLGFYAVLTHGSAALVSHTFLSGQAKYGEAAPFWLYFVCSVVSLLFIALAVPDTGNIAGDDGEDVDSLFDDMWFWSENNPMSCLCRTTMTCTERCDKQRNRRRGQEMSRIKSCFEDRDGNVEYV